MERDFALKKNCLSGNRFHLTMPFYSKDYSGHSGNGPQPVYKALDDDIIIERDNPIKISLL